MDQYEVIVPIEGFKLRVKTEASNPKDAKSNAISDVMYKFPLEMNKSDSFQIEMMVVGYVTQVRRI